MHAVLTLRVFICIFVIIMHQFLIDFKSLGLESSEIWSVSLKVLENSQPEHFSVLCIAM